MKKIDFTTNLPETIYTDIDSLPAEMLLGVTIHYYNNSLEPLYLKFFGQGPTGWSKNAQEIGLVSAKSDGYINLDNFLSRSKPASACQETLVLTLRGYTDSGYSDLYAQEQGSATVVFIDSNDGSWTQDELDNFDGGTVEGWAVLNEYEGHPADYSGVAVANDFALSAPNSLKMTYKAYYSGMRERRVRLYKGFTTTGDRDTIYAIINVRVDCECEISGCPAPSAQYAALKYLEIKTDDTVIIHIGKSWDVIKTDYFPRERWFRFMIPLPKSTTFELRVVVDISSDDSGVGEDWWVWLDDVKIISK